MLIYVCTHSDMLDTLSTLYWSFHCTSCKQNWHLQTVALCYVVASLQNTVRAQKNYRALNKTVKLNIFTPKLSSAHYLHIYQLHFGVQSECFLFLRYKFALNLHPISLHRQAESTIQVSSCLGVANLFFIFCSFILKYFRTESYFKIINRQNNVHEYIGTLI